MSTDDVKLFFERWRTILLTLGALIGSLAFVVSWGDSRWVKIADLEPIQENVEFLTRELLRDRIAELDGRIQVLELTPIEDRNSRRTLNELRLRRNEFQNHLNRLNIE